MRQEDAAKRLADKFNVSIDRANAALLLAGGDILDAAQLLEREGPDREPQVATYSTATRSQPPVRAAAAPGPNAWERVWTIVKGIFLHPVANRLEVEYSGGGRLNVPALIVCLGLLVAFWITAGALFVGWLLGCKYTLRGPEVDIPQANWALDKAYGLMEKCRRALGL